MHVRPRAGFDSGMEVAPGLKTFAGLDDALEELGWERGVTMHAHLYDWRLGPTEWQARGGSLERLRREVRVLPWLCMHACTV